jgi:hypothetical protein
MHNCDLKGSSGRTLGGQVGVDGLPNELTKEANQPKPQEESIASNAYAIDYS